MTILPFIQTLSQGPRRWRVTGILTVAPDGIAVEWRSDEYARRRLRSDEHIGRGQLHHALIPWSLLDGVVYAGRFIRAGELRIRARTMNALEVLPGAEGPFWSVRVAKPERRRAREFALAAEAAVNATMRLLQHRTRA